MMYEVEKGFVLVIISNEIKASGVLPWFAQDYGTMDLTYS